MCHKDLPNRRFRSRRGSVLILTVLMVVFMFAVLALSVDLGYIYVTRTEMQRSADAAAMAAAWDLWDQQARSADPTIQQSATSAEQFATQYARLNPTADTDLSLDESDVTVGYLRDLSDKSVPLDAAPATNLNAARVSIRRNGDRNGQVPLFFARALGLDSISQGVEATAGYVFNFEGFTSPSNGENLDLLPIALDDFTWNALLQGSGTDNWGWDAENNEVYSGPDGIPEINLYPRGTGSPGNRGTLDIGSSDNSTVDLRRQIIHGISKSDLAYHGGKLQFDAYGELLLNADTGISAAIKSDLAAIKGKPRMIPVFSQLSGNGNTANYTCIKFVGIRILDVRLTGKLASKRVIVQPTAVETLGGIPASSMDAVQKTHHIYSPVILAR